MKRALHNITPCSMAIAALLWALPSLAQQDLTADNSAGAGTAIVTTASPPLSAETTPSTAPAAPAIPAPVAEDPAVSAVMDRLKQDESRISVGDLTAAQDTVARLDLMLQIEKKLSEIEKTRQDRSSASLMLPPGTGNLPASMSAESIAGSIPPLPAGQATPPVTSGNGEYSVVRIAGRQGNYSATLMTPEGKQITVRSGDSLSDGLKVSSIASSGVKVTSKSGTKTLPLSGS